MRKTTIGHTLTRVALTLLLTIVGLTYASARWVGNSAINVNGTWYYAGNVLDWTTGGAFDGQNLGNLTSLSIGGQSQVYTADGDIWGQGTMTMGYRIDNGDDQTITLTWFGSTGNNNILQSGGSDFAATDIDISGLSVGTHTISVWFVSENTYDSNTNSQNYVATFTKPYTITYNLNGGSLTTEHNTYYNNDQDIVLDQPTRSNYDFDGWYTNEGLTGDPVTTIAAGSTGNVELWAKWLEGYYVPTRVEGEYLTIAPERDYYAEGRTVTLTVTKAQGVTLQNITVSTNPSWGPEGYIPPTSIEVTKVNDTYTFVMPASSVQINCDYYVDNGAYAINLGSNLEGVVKAQVDNVYVRSANEGDEVTLIFSDPDNKVASNVAVIGATSGNTVTVNGTAYQYTFTMPAEAVTVTADLGYGINIMTQSPSHGEVTAYVGGVEVTTADVNAEVTLTVSHDDGYALSNLYVSYYDMSTYQSVEVTLTKVSDTEYKFIMPAATVTVYPMFVLTLADAADNSSTISTLVQDEFYGSVMLQDRTLYKDGKWNTLCLPFDVKDRHVNPSGMIAIGSSFPLQGATLKLLDVEGTYGDGGTSKTGFDADSGTLSLYFKDPVADDEDVLIPAGTPFLAMWEEGDNIVNPTFSDVSFTANTPTPVTTTDGKVNFIGTFDPVSLTANDKNSLFLGGDNSLYYPNTNYSLGAFRAYFHVDGLTAVRSYVLNFGDGEANGIVDAEANSSLFTLHSSLTGWYTLDGRKLSGKPSVSGVYVNNGRKVVIK